MSDQPYKPPIGIHYPTQWEKDYVKLHQENAALRQQVERLEHELKKAHGLCGDLFMDSHEMAGKDVEIERLQSAIRAHRELSTKLRDRAQAAEAALEQHKYDKLNHFNAVETLNEEIRDRDCTIAALREGLEGLVNHSRSPDSAERDRCVVLLGSPNPGARVAAVMTAVLDKYVRFESLNKSSEELEAAIVEAVRALDKREESDAKS